MSDAGGTAPGPGGTPQWYSASTPAPPPPGAPFTPSRSGKGKGARKAAASIAFFVVVIGLVAAFALLRSGDDGGGGGGEVSRENENPDRRPGSDGGPTVDDHWHAAYGVFLCEGWATPFPDQGPDALGIHTHADGLIHIHPFGPDAEGENANLGAFLDQLGMEFADDRLTMPDGKGFGTEGCDGKPTKLLVAVWPSRDAETPEVYEAGFEELRFLADSEIWALAVVPEGGSLTKPPTVDNLDDPGDL